MATCFIIFFLTIKSVQKRTILLYMLPKQGALYCSSGTSAASVLPYSRPSSFSPGLRPGTGVPSPTPVPAFGWDFSAQSRPSAAKLGVSFSFFRHCVWLGAQPLCVQCGRPRTLAHTRDHLPATSGPTRQSTWRRGAAQR
jgi:hypothetical protein